MPTKDWNREAWGREHSWEEGGDEWSGMAAHCKVPYPEWKRGLIEAFLLPYLGPDRDVVEIAPGHGRWSETIIPASRSVRLVDLNPECLQACKERFADATNVEYIQTDGSSIPVEDASADFVWSFDSFVHIDPPDVFAYIAELARVLRPGGYAVIHHADKTDAGLALAPKLADKGKPGKVATRVVAQHLLRGDGNRSNLNGRMVAERAEEVGLRIAQQTDRWGPGGRSTVTRYHDTITTFHQPR
jgi:ubiquinone/menaquinone biosynthesis C-methylase UbiE